MKNAIRAISRNGHAAFYPGRAELDEKLGLLPDPSWPDDLLYSACAYAQRAVPLRLPGDVNKGIAGDS